MIACLLKIPLFFNVLDLLIKAFLILPGPQDVLHDRLEIEANIYRQSDGPAEAAPQDKQLTQENEPEEKSEEKKKRIDDEKQKVRERKIKDLERLTKLLEVNHQRVSASISHVSIMGAILLFSFKSLFACNPVSRTFVSVELCVYLSVIVALLRCLRDFGLDEDYGSKGLKMNTYEYEKDLMKELSFRYGILRGCNFILISGTALFLALLVFHLLLPTSISGYLYPAWLSRTLHLWILGTEHAPSCVP
jgi:hypothetical protein